jgi:hypothetical protein
MVSSARLSGRLSLSVIYDLDALGMVYGVAHLLEALIAILALLACTALLFTLEYADVRTYVDVVAQGHGIWGGTTIYSLLITKSSAL